MQARRSTRWSSKPAAFPIPGRSRRSGLADPQLSLHGVIVLVDAAAALDQAADPLLADTLQRQLRAADLVVLNKIDRADAVQLQNVRAWVEAVAGKTPQFETEQARLPAPLLDLPQPDLQQRGQQDCEGASCGHASRTTQRTTMRTTMARSSRAGPCDLTVRCGSALCANCWRTCRPACCA